jgi:hypothetical protein
LLSSCDGTLPDEESVVEAELAVNVCNTTSVAANLLVDNIPAYAQCAVSTNAAIYSNNGVDTATSAASSDWKRTQFDGGYQCTELVHRYWLFKWNITWLPNGNAGTWCNTTPPSTSGIVQTATPVHGDAIVFAPGSCGVDTTYGHVALVDTVDSAGSKVTFVEQNNAGRRTNAWSCATCFLHVVANNGSAGSASAGGAVAVGGAQSFGGAVATGGNGISAGGRGNAGGGTPFATGGRSTNTGGANSSGGRAASGGSSASPTGGYVTLSTGGSPPSSNGGSNHGAGTAPSTGGMTTANGGSSVFAAGGTSSTPTPSTVSGGNATTNGTAAAAGQAVASDDAGLGCGCHVPHRNASNRRLGFLGLAILGLLGIRKRHTPAQRPAP